MEVTEISLRNFRNYKEQKIEFDKGVNLIVGDNAQGKTNLLDAIVFAGSGKSLRTQKNAELIRFGEEFGEISASVHSGDREHTLRWVLFPGTRPRQLYHNGVKKKSAGEISGVLQTVLFCPEDLMILKSGGAGRRRLADTALCQMRPGYEAALNEYNRVLEQKNRILKEHFENPALLEVLPEFNRQLCRAGAVLISYRARYFDALGKAAAVYHDRFSGQKEEFSLSYQTVSTVKDPFAAVAVLEENLREHLESHSRAELESAQCLTGPHKDDFDITLSGINLKAFGSQGQIRTGTISLKLAQRAIMEKQTGSLPVLLLDDVLSELDSRRQDFVLNQISEGQVFITCCQREQWTKAGQTIRIRDGQVE